ncbi:MAG: M10 family metallopeptidase, partial [Xenococcaceae cyanobacterium]
MGNDITRLGNNVVQQLDADKLLNADLENNKSSDLSDILNRNSQLNQSFGWIGTSPEEVNTSLNAPRCDCLYCCGISSSDFVANNNLNNLTADTSSLAAAASDVSNFPIDKKTIDTLLSGEKWNVGGNKTITYSFYDDDVPNSYYGDERVSEVSEGIKRNVRQILQNIEPYIDLKFVEVEDSRNSYGQIRYQLTDMGGGYAYAYYPGNYGAIASDVHLSNKEDVNDGGGGFQSGQGSYGYETIIHETLHGLGLKHPGDYNGDGSGDPPFLADGQDNNTNTVMTYNDGGAGASTIMPYDIKALQYLYGANKNYNHSNTNYSFNQVYAFSDGTRNWGTQNRATKLAIWDTGGTDTLDFSKLKFDNSGYRFDLRMGGILTTQNAYNANSYSPYAGSGQYTTSRFGTVIADEVNIENVVNSSSDDEIFANSSANIFSGYSQGKSTGDDIIKGSNGKDTLDLSDYKVSDFTTRKSGYDLIVDLNSNGSIRVDDYYQVAEGDR